MTSTSPRLRRLEWIVEDLDPPIDLFCSGIGFELLSRQRHETLDAEYAVICAGELELVLMRPTSTGQGDPIREPQPCLIQLVFEGQSPDDIEEMRTRLIAAGTSVSDDGPGEFHLARTMIEDLFGSAPVLTFMTSFVPSVPDR